MIFFGKVREKPERLTKGKKMCFIEESELIQLKKQIADSNDQLIKVRRQRDDEIEHVLKLQAEVEELKKTKGATGIHHYSEIREDLTEEKEPFYHYCGGKRAREVQQKRGKV